MRFINKILIVGSILLCSCSLERENKKEDISNGQIQGVGEKENILVDSTRATIDSAIIIADLTRKRSRFILVEGGELLLPQNAIDDKVNLPLGTACSIDFKKLDFDLEGVTLINDSGKIYNNVDQIVSGEAYHEVMGLLISYDENFLKSNQINRKKIKLTSVEIECRELVVLDTGFQMYKGIIDSVKMRLPDIGNTQVYLSSYTDIHDYFMVVNQNLILYNPKTSKVKVIILGHKSYGEVGAKIMGVFCINNQYDVRRSKIILIEGSTYIAEDSIFSLKSIVNQ